MPSLAKHHLLRAYLPLMVPFRTRFSRHEVVHVAYVQRLMGYLYTSWWSTTFLLYASRHTQSTQRTRKLSTSVFALVYAGEMESNTGEVLWMPPKWKQMLHGIPMEIDQRC